MKAKKSTVRKLVTRGRKEKVISLTFMNQAGLISIPDNFYDDILTKSFFLIIILDLDRACYILKCLHKYF